MEFSNQFIHHVFFWLHQPDNIQDRDRLIQGLRTLVAIPGIQRAHIGVPAGTTRDVVDASYAVSWLAVFDDRAAQDAYQVDPVHLAFVEACGHLWTRVVVTDSITA
ncbi:Dabb family protein [Dinghuibacter silviterrae]|nr:Dabb family protein [Dinghuibacter silviterrae]